MKITFGDGASDMFQDLVLANFCDYTIRVTPVGESESFDATLLGGRNDDSEWLDELRIVRLDEETQEPIAEPEFIRVEEIMVY